MANTLLWISPEVHGGIASYTRDLFPAIKELATQNGFESAILLSPQGKREAFLAIREAAKLQPKVIHIQHEYGVFGGKVPPLYYFPQWLKKLSEDCPDSTVVVTAHTVIQKEFKYPVKNRGWQGPLRSFANRFFVEQLKVLWRERTFEKVDGIIVHSATQLPTLASASRAPVFECAHYVVHDSNKNLNLKTPPPIKPNVVLFGFISPEKGQDLVVQAWKECADRANLIIAGGVRRKEDQPYADRVYAMVRKMNLENTIEFTGFVPDSEIESLYEKASLVLAPFRETSGSGSITHAFARGKPVLASDLELNREINERVTGTIEVFKSEDTQDLARHVLRLLSDPAELSRLSMNAKVYAENYSIEKTALRHLEIYRELQNQ